MSVTPRFFSSVRIASQNFEDSPWLAVPRPQPQNVSAAPQIHADGRVEGPVGDLPVPDLHVDGVDEDRDVVGGQWPTGPVVHLLDHLLSDRGDDTLGDARTVYFREMRRDLTCGQSTRIQRQHHRVDITQSTLTLLHHHRVEAAVPISRHLDLDRTHRIGQHGLRAHPITRIAAVTAIDRMLLIPQMRGHLLIQSGFQNSLGEQLQQTIRASQSKTTILGRLHHLSDRSPLRNSRLANTLVDRSGQGSHAPDHVGHHRTFPADTLVYPLGRLHRSLHRPPRCVRDG